MHSPLVKTFWATFVAGSLLVAVNIAADGVTRREQPQPTTKPPAATPVAAKPAESKPVAAAPAKEAPAPVAEAAPAPTPALAPAPAPAATPAAARVADAGAGATVARKCAGCHTFEAGQPNRVGPNLHGILGAKVAGRAGFTYSAALQAKGGEWTRESLDAFLAAPAAAVAGTKMAFPGLPSADDRADLIAYLDSQAGKAAIAEAAPAPAPAEPKPAPVAAAAPEPAPVAVAEAPAAPAPAPASEPVAEPAATAKAEEPEPADIVQPAIANGPPMRAELAGLLATASVERGKKLAKVCAECHSFDAKGGKSVGPNLRGVIGRDIGSHPGFSFSVTLQALEGNWIYDWLDQFLEAPDTFAPGTKMTFPGMAAPRDRADVIAYLRSLSPNAPPLPNPVVWLVPAADAAAAN